MRIKKMATLVKFKEAFPDNQAFVDRMGNSIIGPILISDPTVSESLFGMTYRKYQDRIFTHTLTDSVDNFSKIISLVEIVWLDAYKKFIKVESLMNEIVQDWKGLSEESRTYLTNNVKEESVEGVLEKFLTAVQKISREKLNNDELYMKLIEIPGYNKQFLLDLSGIFMPFVESAQTGTTQISESIFLSGENVSDVGLVDANGNFTGVINRIYSKDAVDSLNAGKVDQTQYDTEQDAQDVEIGINTQSSINNANNISTNVTDIASVTTLSLENSNNINDIDIEQASQNIEIASNTNSIDDIDQRTTTVTEDYSPLLGPTEVLPTSEINFNLSTTQFAGNWILGKNYEFTFYNELTAATIKLVKTVQADDIPLDISFPSGNDGTAVLTSSTNTLTLKDNVGSFGTLAYIKSISELAEVGAGTPALENTIERQTTLEAKVLAQLIIANPEAPLDYVIKSFFDAVVNPLKDKTQNWNAAGTIYTFIDGAGYEKVLDFESATRTILDIKDINGSLEFWINSGVILKIARTAIDMFAEIDMNDNKITNLGDPINLKDAATKEYVDNSGGSGTEVRIEMVNGTSYTLNEYLTQGKSYSVSIEHLTDPTTSISLLEVDISKCSKVYTTEISDRVSHADSSATLNGYEGSTGSTGNKYFSPGKLVYKGVSMFWVINVFSISTSADRYIDRFAYSDETNSALYMSIRANDDNVVIRFVEI